MLISHCELILTIKTFFHGLLSPFERNVGVKVRNAYMFMYLYNNGLEIFPSRIMLFKTHYHRRY